MRFGNFFASSHYLDPLPDVSANSDTLTTALGFMFTLAAALAVIYVIVSAVRFTISGGDPNKVSQARQGLIYSLVGLGVAVSALAIRSFVISRAKPAASSSDIFFGKDGILATVANGLSYAVGIASVIMVIVGAIRFITSAGNPQSAQAARKTIIYSLIGLAIAIIAGAMVSFVLSRL